MPAHDGDVVRNRPAKVQAGLSEHGGPAILDAENRRSRRKRSNPLVQGKLKDVEVVLVLVRHRRHVEHEALVPRLFHGRRECVLKSVVEWIRVYAVEAAVREVPEAMPQEPLRRHRPLADNVIVNTYERGVFDFGGDVDYRQTRPVQHCEQRVGFLGAQINDDAVELPREGVACDFVGRYLLQDDAAPFLDKQGNAGEDPLRKRGRGERIGDECDPFLFPWQKWMLFFHGYISPATNAG